MLSNFPDLSPLKISLKDSYEHIVNQFPSYSDFNFVSLFNWDTVDDIRVATLNGNLVVRFSDYVTNELSMTFIGQHNGVDTIDRLFEYCSRHHIQKRLNLVPEIVIDTLSPEERSRYDIHEDRDNHDYILSVRNLAEFSRAMYGPKKRLYNYFVKHYGDRAHSVDLDLASSTIRQGIETVISKWQISRKKNDTETRNEFIAIRRCLDNSKELGVQGFGVYVDKQLVAFQIFEILPNHTVMDHFEKADIIYKGIFEYKTHTHAKYLETKNIKYINIQQHLGLEGMRQAKESYKPIHFLKKYTIKPL